MGNRAIVIFENNNGDRSPGVYLHWNGGPESVYPFLEYMAFKDCRMAGDPSYAAARLAQIVGNFFGGTLSVGMLNAPADDDDAREMAAWNDHGVYIVGTGDGAPYRMRARFAPGKMTAEEIEGERARAGLGSERAVDMLRQIAAANDAAFNRA